VSPARPSRTSKGCGAARTGHMHSADTAQEGTYDPTEARPAAIPLRCPDAQPREIALLRVVVEKGHGAPAQDIRN